MSIDLVARTITLIVRTIALVDFVVKWGLGWRYLISREFRGRMHAKWARMARGAVIAEIAFALLAFAVLNGFLVLVGIWLYDGIVAPRLGREIKSWGGRYVGSSPLRRV